MRFPSHTRRVVAISLASGLLLLAAGSAATSAAATSTATLTTLPAEPTRAFAPIGGDGPQFYSGVAVEIAGDIDGDVYASGQSVIVSGSITGDVIAAAQTITISGDVDGNVRLAGQDVTISGDISRSGTIFAATVAVTDTGSFGNDLLGAAGDISVAGEIGRNLTASVGTLAIDGTVGGDVSYQSDRTARIAEGAVGGTVEQIRTPESPEVDVSPWALFVGWLLGLLYALVALSLVTVAAALLLPRQLDRVTARLVPSPWLALLVGFLASFVVPVAILAGFVSIIGAPLALAALLVWLVLTLATFVYGAYYIGRLLFRGDQHPVVKSLVGGVILIVALNVPWVNILVWAAMLFFGLGAQLLDIYGRRPWRTRPDDADAAGPAASL
jgi:cytoskeletal protein CcmA (bactofilin family)